MPKRIQRKRTEGWRMPENTVYVGRGSKWGNPWIVDPERATYPPRNQYRATLGECLDLYRDYALQMSGLAREELAGKNLACWCGVKAPCHADVLLELANSDYEDGRKSM